MHNNKLTSDIVRHYIEFQLFGIDNPSLLKSFNIGAELELFPVINNAENKLQPVNLYNGKNALIHPLMEIVKKHNGIAKNRHSKTDALKPISQIDEIQFPNKSRLFFEPGGQIEISTKPCSNLKELESQLKQHQNILDMVSSKTNIEFIQSGIHPIAINQLSNQLQKGRYIALEKYLNTISSYGKQMMLRTCAMHINMQIGIDESIKLKRIIAANLLAPFATAIFSNSYTPSQRANSYKSYRSFIWKNIDNTRTGILPLANALESMSINHLVDAYYNFVVNAPIIYIPNLKSNTIDPKTTLKDWMSHKIGGTFPNLSHLQNHLSLLFPEVRLKGYLELRSIDTPPKKWQMVPLCFYSGILYDDLNLDKVIELIQPLYDHFNTIHSLACYGLEDTTIYKVSKQIMKIAIDGFSRLPNDFKTKKHMDDLLLFNEQFVAQRTTFADIKNIN